MLLLCDCCHGHMFEGETVCPHCGAENPIREQNSIRPATGVVWMALIIASGCYGSARTIMFLPEDDIDGDGFLVAEGDCDDTDETVHPDAEEIYYDGIDQNCDEMSDYDADEDGFESDEYGGEDCDDEDDTVHPMAEELPADGLDSNCDGDDDT